MQIDTVLLDRDGTVIVDKHYLSDPDGVELLPGAATGLRHLARAGLKLFLVTNQSGIGRGYFTEEAYQACHAALEKHLCGEEIALEDSVFCPHAPEEGCMCRKPNPGMWRTLAARHGLDAATSAMVGDKAEDIAFGRCAGFAATVLVLTGKGRQTADKLSLPLPGREEAYRAIDASHDGSLPHAIARDLDGAARFILGDPAV